MCHEPTDDQSIRTPADEDASYERTVFLAVLEIHPGHDHGGGVDPRGGPRS